MHCVTAASAEAGPSSSTHAYPYCKPGLRPHPPRPRGRTRATSAEAHREAAELLEELQQVSWGEEQSPLVGGFLESLKELLGG